MKKKQYGNQTINIIIVISILVVLNLLSLNIFYRLDLTKGSIYSLSKSSKKTVENLKDNLVIKAYFTKNLPNQYADSRRYTRDLLSEYQAYSHGKLRFEFIDPKDEDKLKIEARQNHISPVSMKVVENDKVEIREVYMGLAFLYEDKTETIPLIKNTQGLEYDITTTLKRITSQNLAKVAFFTTDNQPEMMQNPYMQNQDEFKDAKQFLSSNYQMEKTDLNAPVDSTITTMVVTSISDSLSNQQLYNLDQFLMHGGNLVIFQQTIDTDLQRQTASPIKSNIFDLLKHYGVKLKNNLVSDAECGQVTVQERRGIFTMNTPVAYPFFPIVHDTDSKNPIVTGINNVQFIFTSEIDTTRIHQGVKFTSLLKSSNHSGETSGPRYDISFNKFKGQDLTKMLNGKGRILAGIYEGKFTSYFGAKNNKNYKPFVENATIIIVGDSDFIKNGAGIGIKGNVDFLQNSIDYLSGDSALITLRSRQAIYRPIKQLPPAGRKIVKWLNILLPTILLIIFGLLHYKNLIRKRKYVRDLYE
jgi:gliding-associated putative ABC transporter substrate-binding component GldG